MALDTSINKLALEIEYAEQIRDKYLAVWDQMVKSFHGPAYLSAVSGMSAPATHALEYISLVVPRIIHDNPRVRVKSARPGSHRQMASAIKHGVNRNVRDTKFRAMGIKLATDFCFAWCVAIEKLEEVPGETDEFGLPRLRPVTKRIDPKMFFTDPLGQVTGTPAYSGHGETWLKSDLLKEAEDPESGWDKEAIETLDSPSGTTEKWSRSEDITEGMPVRDEVLVREVWVPDANDLSEFDIEHLGPANGYNGSIFTLGSTLKDGASATTMSDYIRDPRPYFGPPTGPYNIGGAYYVPSKPYPLGPICSTWAQEQAYQQFVAALDKAAREYKISTICDAADPNLERALKAVDGYVFSVPGFDKKQVAQVEQGGFTDQMGAHKNEAREKLDRASGIHDAQRGNIRASGNTSATEVAVADEASTVRMSFIVNQFRDFALRTLYAKAWFLYHTEEVVFFLGSEASIEKAKKMRAQAETNPELAEVIEVMEQQGGDKLENLLDIQFQGGPTKDQLGTFADLELEIEAFSMERTNSALNQQMAFKTFDLLAQLAPTLPQTASFIDWDKALDDLGEAMNRPELGEYVNMDAAAELAGVEAQQQEQEGVPRLKGDVPGGGRGGAKQLTGGKAPGELAGNEAGTAHKVGV